MLSQQNTDHPKIPPTAQHTTIGLYTSQHASHTYHVHLAEMSSIIYTPLSSLDIHTLG